MEPNWTQISIMQQFDLGSDIYVLGIARLGEPGIYRIRFISS